MIVIDVETTGIDPWKHSLLSIGAVDFDNPTRQFYEECQMFEGAHVMPEALVVNGFTEAQIRDTSKQSDEELVKRFLDWISNTEERTLGGHIHYMDLYFIIATAERYNIDYSILSKRIVDLHSVCYAHLANHGVEIPQKNGHTDITSSFAEEYTGIPAEPQPHHGLNGAKWEAEALSRLLYDKPLLEEFKQYPIPWLK